MHVYLLDSVCCMKPLGHWTLLFVMSSSSTLAHPPVTPPHDLVMSQCTRTDELLELRDLVFRNLMLCTGEHPAISIGSHASKSG